MKNKINRKTCFAAVAFVLFITVPIFYLSMNTVKSSEDKDDKKIVYLTFDDGPSYVTTGKLLDVLKRYNVKATFFVVGKEIEGKEDILKRIYSEGHEIGLHTYTHNVKKIYSNNKEFMGEMLKTSEKIKEVIGISPKIIRFPCGSYRRLSYSLLNELHENNFKVYDWNVSIDDGLYPNASAAQLFNNCKKYSGDPPSLIVLMHCNYANKNTVKALPKIIEYYKSLGYEFKSINQSTPEYYYNIRRR